MGEQVPVVDWLVLDGEPHLEATACTACGARSFGRRNGCARCGGRSLERRPVSTTGTLSTYTIVHRAAPGLPVPFVSAIVALDDGATVQSNLVDIDPDPEKIELGMPVRLTTYVAATDDDGREAVAFGFTPLS